MCVCVCVCKHIVWIKHSYYNTEWVSQSVSQYGEKDLRHINTKASVRYDIVLVTSHDIWNDDEPGHF